jgi:hypothetical protein
MSVRASSVLFASVIASVLHVTACSSPESATTEPQASTTAPPPDPVAPTTSTTLAAPSPTTTQPPTTTTTDPRTGDAYNEPTLDGVDIAHCQLLDRSTDLQYQFRLSTGFPVETANFEPAGTFRIALIPLEFDDFAGTTTDIDDAAQHTELVSDWYSMVSDGRVTIDWQIHPSLIRVPADLADFALERSRSDDDRLARVAFAAVDPFVDFTDVRAAIFLLPRNSD